MLKAVLEGLLFVVGEDGLTIEQIEDVLNTDEENAKKHGKLIIGLSLVIWFLSVIAMGM